MCSLVASLFLATGSTIEVWQPAFVSHGKECKRQVLDDDDGKLIALILMDPKRTRPWDSFCIVFDLYRSRSSGNPHTGNNPSYHDRPLRTTDTHWLP